MIASQKFNYALPLNHYTLKRALLWGICAAHFQQARKETGTKRVVHFLISAVLFIPIIGQIASIFEKIIIQTSIKKINLEKKSLLQCSKQNSQIEKNCTPLTKVVIDGDKKNVQKNLPRIKMNVELDDEMGSLSGEFEGEDLKDFERVFYEGDGHCLFRSIGYYINMGYQDLRNQVANALRDNEEYRDSFGYTETKKPNSTECWTFEDYIEDIRNLPEYNGEGARPVYDQEDPISRRGWGSQLEIRVVYNLFKRPICLYMEDQKKFSIYPDNLTLEEAKENEETLFIYYDGEGHFDAMPLASSLFDYI